MKKVRITAVRKVQHEDLMARYERPNNVGRANIEGNAIAEFAKNH